MSTPHRLTSLQELDAALAHSAQRPIVIFKHSSTCGTSAMAYEEIEAWIDTLLGGTSVPIDVYVVHVQTSRAVSNAIATRLGVRHESPQVLLVHEGAVRWSASHFRVTAEAIAAAVQRFAPAPPQV